MFRNRGSLPNINNGTDNSVNDGRGYGAPHYSHYWNGRFIIVQYDKNFLIIELVLTLIILLFAIAVYFFAYKASFNDPIAETKKNFFVAQFIAIMISIVLTGLVTFFTKSSKDKLIKNLKSVALISIVMIVALFGIKLHIDSKYNDDVFAEFYDKYEYSASNDENSKKISLGLSGIKLATLKESYIEESKSAYTNFSWKATLYMIVHILVVIIIFYLAYRLSAVERKRERLAKDDAILYDEEQNIKF